MVLKDIYVSNCFLRFLYYDILYIVDVIKAVRKMPETSRIEGIYRFSACTGVMVGCNVHRIMFQDVTFPVSHAYFRLYRR